MLVLTRKRDDVIKIGENIVIRVIRTGRSSVKIGVEAPAHIKVIRGELALHEDHSDVTSQAADEADLEDLVLVAY